VIGMDGAWPPDRDVPTSDDELMARLRAVAHEVDPIPDRVIEAARAAISTRDLNGELAMLLADSHLQDGLSPGGMFEPVRSHAATQHRPRLLTFTGGGVQIDLELSPRDDLMDLLGQLSGALTSGCAIQHAASGWHPLDVDDLGRFGFRGLAHGPIRVRCRSARGTVVTTTWVTT
jgi:hypothetical protein